MHLVRALPLIAIAVIIYVLLVAASPETLDKIALTIPMPSKGDGSVLRFC